MSNTLSPEDLSRYVDLAAAMAGVAIPTACRPEVESNLALLLRHAAVCAAADDPACDPAELLRP